MEVLSTVRAMQDEIQDINEQIEKENKKLKVGSSSQNHNVSFCDFFLSSFEWISNMVLS